MEHTLKSEIKDQNIMKWQYWIPNEDPFLWYKWCIWNKSRMAVEYGYIKDLISTFVTFLCERKMTIIMNDVINFQTSMFHPDVPFYSLFK